MTAIHAVRVEFGDCDPVGIAFSPDFSRWMDEALLACFRACGVPLWRELIKTCGIVGEPLLEIHVRFFRSATATRSCAATRCHAKAQKCAPS